MVRIIFIALSILLLSGCQENSALKFWSTSNQTNSGIDTVLFSKPTRIAFQDTFIDLGDVYEGREYRITYHYQNIGQAPLMVFNVSPSCGCTIAEFSHHPLQPGNVDSIVAKFDSKDKLGSYIKNIKVNCNTAEKVHNLSFRVNVLK